MLYTLALILIIAWLLGLVSSYTLGGFIHILLIVAIVMILVQLIQGRGRLVARKCETFATDEKGGAVTHQ